MAAAQRQPERPPPTRVGLVVVLASEIAGNDNFARFQRARTGRAISVCANIAADQRDIVLADLARAIVAGPPPAEPPQLSD